MKNPIGACIWSLPGEDFHEQLQLAQRCGLDGLQLDIHSGGDGMTLMDEVMIHRAAELAEETGLKYASMGIGAFCECAATNPAEHPFLRELLDAAIHASNRLSIPLLQIPSFFASALEGTDDIARTAELMRYACQRAEVVGIDVCTENVLTIPELNDFINQVNMPNFKVYYDTANPHSMAGLDAVELLRGSKDLIAQVHLKDESDDRKPALLGEGDTGFERVYAELRELGYEGWYIFESPYVDVMIARDLTAEEVLKKDLRAVGY